MRRKTLFGLITAAVVSICSIGQAYDLTLTTSVSRGNKTISGTATAQLNELPNASGCYNGAINQTADKISFCASYDSFTGILNISVSGPGIGADNAVYQGPPNNLRLVRGDANTAWPASLVLTP